jgi:hypothetical protein
MIQTRPVRLHLKVSTGRAVWYSIIGDSSALSVRSFAITSLIEKPCCRDNPRGGLEPRHVHFTWLVYQNHCFQWLGPMLQRRHLAVLKSRPSTVPQSTDFGPVRNAAEDHSLVRLSSKSESDRITQRSAVQIRPPPVYRNHRTVDTSKEAHSDATFWGFDSLCGSPKLAAEVLSATLILHVPQRLTGERSPTPAARLVAGIFLIQDGLAELQGAPHWDGIIRQSIAVAAAVLLLVGLWTPLAGALVVIVELWTAPSRPHSLRSCVALAALIRHNPPLIHQRLRNMRTAAAWRCTHNHSLRLTLGKCS